MQRLCLRDSSEDTIHDIVRATRRQPLTPETRFEFRVTSHVFRGARSGIRGGFSQRFFSFLLLIIIPPFLYIHLSQLAGAWDVPEQTEHHHILRPFISVPAIRWLQDKEVKFQPNEISAWPVRYSMMQQPTIPTERDCHTCCERRSQLFAVAATCAFYGSAWEIRTLFRAVQW
jgi:hypothetical protein